jgi:phage baseplate assembly protein W
MKGDDYSGFVFWDKEGIVFSKNEKELIKENIKRILTTRKGERVNNPAFGSRVKEFLFMPQMYVDDLLLEIKSSIEQWEPRVKVNSCTISSNTLLQQDVVNIKLELLINTPDGVETLETEVEV